MNNPRIARNYLSVSLRGQNDRKWHKTTKATITKPQTESKQHVDDVCDLRNVSYGDAEISDVVERHEGRVGRLEDGINAATQCIHLHASCHTLPR